MSDQHVRSRLDGDLLLELGLIRYRFIACALNLALYKLLNATTISVCHVGQLLLLIQLLW